MTQLDKLNKDLAEAKAELDCLRKQYYMMPSDDNFNSAVIAYDIVSSLQLEIIELLLTR